MSRGYRQCKFKKGNIHQTAWVEDGPHLKIGEMITLKSDNREKWELVEMGENVHRSEMIHTWQM